MPKSDTPPANNTIPLALALTKVRTLLAGLLCTLPALFLSNRLPTLHTLPDNKWLVVVFLAACEIFLIVLLWALRPPAPAPPTRPLKTALLAGAAAFLATHLLSALLCSQPAYSLRSALPLLVLVVLFIAAVWQPPSPGNLLKTTILMLAIGAAVGTIALLQGHGFDPLASLVRYREATRYRTGVYVTLGNPEYLGGYLAPLAMAALGLAAAASNRWARAAALLAALLTAIPAFLTGSRGAFLGMGAATAALLIGYLAAHPRVSRRAFLYAAAAGSVLLIALIIALSVSPRASTFGFLRGRLGDLAHPYSDSIRTRIVFNLAGAEMIARHPVTGIGPGMFGLEFYPIFQDLRRETAPEVSAELARDFNGIVPEHAHNDWLEIWVTTGTLGFAAWLWLVAVWAAALARAFVQRVLPPARRLFLLAPAAAAIALLVNGLFNFPLYDPVRATLLWLTLAWSAAIALDEAD